VNNEYTADILILQPLCILENPLILQLDFCLLKSIELRYLLVNC